MSLFRPRDLELRSRLVRRLYIDRIVSRGLTKDLGVANIDERLVDFVGRSHRRLAPATRHFIILRSRIVGGRSDGRINYRVLSRETRVKRATLLASKRCIFMRSMRRGAIGNGSVERRKYTVRCKHRNYLTFILSLARWPGSTSSSRLDIVEYSPCCSNTNSESGFTWKNHRSQHFFSRWSNRVVLKVTFRLQHRGRMNVARREVPSINCYYELEIWINEQLPCYK